MRSTSERMELLKQRTNAVKEKRQARKHKIMMVSCYALCIGFVVAMSLFFGHMKFSTPTEMSMTNTASIFTNQFFFGYIIVGILAFLLGIFVTLLCNMLHKKNRKDQNNGGTDR